MIQHELSIHVNRPVEQVFAFLVDLKNVPAWQSNLVEIRQLTPGALHVGQTYNAMLVAKYKRDSVDELITLTKDSQQQLIDRLETIPPEIFNKDFGVRFRGYKVTVQRLLEAETKDEQIHYQQITGFFKESQ